MHVVKCQRACTLLCMAEYMMIQHACDTISCVLICRKIKYLCLVHLSSAKFAKKWYGHKHGPPDSWAGATVVVCMACKFDLYVQERCSDLQRVHGAWGGVWARVLTVSRQRCSHTLWSFLASPCLPTKPMLSRQQEQQPKEHNGLSSLTWFKEPLLLLSGRLSGSYPHCILQTV